jgi:tRNA-dihydrouridine synthase
MNQEKQQEPCYNCHSYCNWVAKDFLASVSDTPVTLKTGVKFDQDKPQWTLVPFKALDEVVKVLTIGARKYAPDNWKKVPNARQRYIDAAFRHMSAYAAGEKLDAETGKNHLAHAVCCLLFLLAFDLDKTLEKTNG